MGIRGVFALVFGVAALRFGAYSLLQSPWFVLFIEPAHGNWHAEMMRAKFRSGVVFALMWACAVTASSRLAPPPLQATAQTLTGAVFLGARMLFLAGAWVFLAAMVTQVALFGVENRSVVFASTVSGVIGGGEANHTLLSKSTDDEDKELELTVLPG
jgi:hypothetical protein